MSMKEDYESKNEFIDWGIRKSMAYLNRKIDLVSVRNRVEEMKSKIEIQKESVQENLKIKSFFEAIIEGDQNSDEYTI